MEELRIELEKVIITRLHDGIIKVEIKRHVEFKVKDLDDFLDIHLEIKTSDKVPFLIIFGENSMAPADVRTKFAEKSRAQIKSKEALVLTSLAHRLIAQFHINFHKPAHPTKIFANEREALKWLRK